MPKRIVALTDTEIRKEKSKDKNYKLYDGGGLFLLVTPSGGKLWRLKYSFRGTENLIALGIANVKYLFKKVTGSINGAGILLA